MMVILLAMVGGLTIGSFLNVVAYRLPRRESLSVPGSHCPTMRQPGPALRQRSGAQLADAPGPLPPVPPADQRRYPMVELTRATLAVAVVIVKHSAERVLGLVLVAILIPVALIDFDERIIPNKITVPAARSGSSSGCCSNLPAVPEQLIAGAAAGGFLLIFALVYPRDGHGGRQTRRGDGPLPRALGRGRGDRGIVGDALRRRRDGARRRHEGRKTAVPFGPSSPSGV